MKYGLSAAQLEEIQRVLRGFPEIERVAIFGSRAVGSFKGASDVDLAVFGEKVDLMTAARVKDKLEEETYLPFFFDVIAYREIDHDALRVHIQRFGKTIYEAVS